MELGLELTIIALFSLLGSVLAVRFRQPSVIGVLLAGALVGPHALGLVQNEELLQVSIDIGAFLLLFLIGMEFSLAKLLKHGVRVLLIAVAKLGTVFIVCYGVAVLAGLNTLSAVLVGVIFSITSTVIFLTILEQKGLHRKKEVELLVGVLILEDIFGVFALTLFSGFESAADLTLVGVAGGILFSLSLLGLVYVFVSRRIGRAVEWLTRYSTKETFTFISIGIALLMGAMASFMGLSAAVGAFLAGNIIASLKNAKEFEKPMHPFIFVFTALFFFSIGAIVDFSAVGEHIVLVIALFAISVIAKFLSIGITSYLFTDTNGKGATYAGLSMVSLGEFSLLLAAEANELVPSLDLVSIVAVVIFLSSITMSIFMTRVESIYATLTKFMPISVRTDLDVASLLMREVSRKGGKKRERNFSIEWKRILNNTLGIAFIGGLLWLWYEATGFRYFAEAGAALEGVAPLWAWGAVALVALLFPTFAIFRNFRHFLADFSASLVETYPKEIANSKKLYRNILLIAFIFVASVVIPPSMVFFGFAPIWGALSIPLLIILVLLFLNSETLLEKIHEHNHRHPHGLHRHEKEVRKK